MPKLRLICLLGLLGILLPLAPAGPSAAEAWPPVAVEMRAARQGNLVTFVMLVVNRTDRPYAYELKARVPEGATLVGCQYGTDRADWRRCGADGQGNIGWNNPAGVAGGGTVGPYTFTVDISGAPRPVSFAWLNLYNQSPAGSWTGPLAAPADTGPVSTVWAGVGSRTVAGNVFWPREVTIPAGATLTFEVASDEPHTVTFLGSGPPPAAPPPLWPANLTPGGAAVVDGASFVNTGIVGKGSRFYLTFPNPGQFRYFCVIHPGMEGVINVVGPGEPYTTQSEGWVRAEQERRQVLGLVPAAREQGLSAFRKTVRPDGTTLWEVQVGSLVRTPTGPLELLEYFPPTVKVRAGDTVRWKADSPHTVTFLAPGQQPPEPLGAPPARPSANYEPGRFYNSGVFAFGPDAPTEFELTFPNPGTFPYLCLLHWPLGHMGTVVVEPR
jgi:plastocyanin